MKKSVIVLSACLLVVGCEDKETPTVLDPATRITLNAAPTSAASTRITPSTAPYSVDTIVRYAMIWGFRTQVDPRPLEGGISKENRDFANKRLMIGLAEEIVKMDKQGNPQLGWILTDGIHDIVLKVSFLQAKPTEWFDIMADNSGVFTNQNRDTIGYIPNAVVRKADAEIKAAFAAKDYGECMRLFREAYVFIPTTGQQWRALKAAGVE